MRGSKIFYYLYSVSVDDDGGGEREREGYQKKYLIALCGKFFMLSLLT